MAEKKAEKKATTRKPAKRPPKKKDPAEERDSLGIKRKDYPIVGAVAVIALNAWAFNTETAIMFRLITIGIDFILGYWLYKRYLAQYMPKRGNKKETAKASSKSVTRSAEAAVDKRGLFGIKSKHYPLLAGAVLLLINVSAFRSGMVAFIVVAVIVDLAIVGYLAYRKYWLPRRRGD